MKSVRAVILDFDGVLAESNGEKDTAFEELFSLYPEHIAPMREFHKTNHAKPRLVKFEHYVERIMKRPGDRQLIDRMAREFSNRVVDRVINCPEVPGATSFLREFSSKVPLYISSITPQDELETIVKARGISSYIKEVFGNPPHAKVDVVQLVLEREKLEPSEVAFVGDSNSDLIVARETGIVFFARDSGQPFEDASLELYADLYAVGETLRTLI